MRYDPAFRFDHSRMQRPSLGQDHPIDRPGKMSRCRCMESRTLRCRDCTERCDQSPAAVIVKCNGFSGGDADHILRFCDQDLLEHTLLLKRHQAPPSRSTQSPFPYKSGRGDQPCRYGHNQKRRDDLQGTEGHSLRSPGRDSFL